MAAFDTTAAGAERVSAHTDAEGNVSFPVTASHRYRVALSDAIDPNSFDAELAKGVLTIRAHKRPEAKPRKIALKGTTDNKRLGDGK